MDEDLKANGIAVVEIPELQTHSKKMKLKSSIKIMKEKHKSGMLDYYAF